MSVERHAKTALRTRRALASLSLLSRTDDKLTANDVRQVIEAIDLQWVDTQRSLLLALENPTFSLAEHPERVEPEATGR